MPVQSPEQETLNVKLVHFTKQNSPDEPVQVAFSVVDEQGKEEIITGEIPYSYDLFLSRTWLADVRPKCGVTRAWMAPVSSSLLSWS